MDTYLELSIEKQNSRVKLKFEYLWEVITHIVWLDFKTGKILNVINVGHWGGGSLQKQNILSFLLKKFFWSTNAWTQIIYPHNYSANSLTLKLEGRNNLPIKDMIASL